MTELGLYSGCVRSEESGRGHPSASVRKPQFYACENRGQLARPRLKRVRAFLLEEARADQIKPDEPFAPSVGHSYQIDPDLSINNAINH